MHLRIVQRRLASIQNNLIRTYKYQSKVFGYNAELKTHGNTEEIENSLREYIHTYQFDYEIFISLSICR